MSENENFKMRILTCQNNRKFKISQLRRKPKNSVWRKSPNGLCGGFLHSVCPKIGLENSLYGMLDHILLGVECWKGCIASNVVIVEKLKGYL